MLNTNKTIIYFRFFVLLILIFTCEAYANSDPVANNKILINSTIAFEKTEKVYSRFLKDSDLQLKSVIDNPESTHLSNTDGKSLKTTMNMGGTSNIVVDKTGQPSVKTNRTAPYSSDDSHLGQKANYEAKPISPQNSKRAKNVTLYVVSAALQDQKNSIAPTSKKSVKPKRKSISQENRQITDQYGNSSSIVYAEMKKTQFTDILYENFTRALLDDNFGAIPLNGRFFDFHNIFLVKYSDYCKSHIQNPVGRKITSYMVRTNGYGHQEREAFSDPYTFYFDKKFEDAVDRYINRPLLLDALELLYDFTDKDGINVKKRINDMLENDKYLNSFIENRCSHPDVNKALENLYRKANYFSPLIIYKKPLSKEVLNVFYSYSGGRFSPDNKSVIKLGSDISTINLDTEISTSWGMQEEDVFKQVSISPNSRFMVTGGDNVPTFIWDIAKNKKLFKLVPDSCDTKRAGASSECGAVSYAIGPYSRLLAIAPYVQNPTQIQNQSSDITLWDLKTGKQIGSYNHGYSWKTYSMVFVENGQNLMTVGRDLDGVVSIRKIDVKSGELMNETVLGKKPNSYFASFAQNGKYLIERDFQQQDFRIINSETNLEVETYKSYGRATAVCFNPKGSILAIALESGNILLWDFLKNSEIKILKNDGPKILALEFSSDSSMLLSLNAKKKMFVWDLRN